MLSLKKNETGSMTLEAALIIPIFLIFFMVLANFIRIAVADMALTKVVSDTVEDIAAYSYPAVALTDAATTKIDDWIHRTSNGVVNLGDLEKLIYKMTENLGYEFSIYDWGGLLLPNKLTNTVRNKFANTVGDTMFDPEKLTVDVKYTNDMQGSIEITGTLEVTLYIPFVDYSIYLKKRAHEGLWSLSSQPAG
ncbi:TadE/TadG family type IV pilus assembly protein [Bacillus kwashiorkori]|uniref:TadE/TadG family type IV pilus assembly protein n=1 Tax=Bacillus kwashiorkori TaxID=1522318 RepID=UPI0007839DA7|nr:TadE family protein [Bacillus kwashiorkori]